LPYASQFPPFEEAHATEIKRIIIIAIIFILCLF
jgi:hypothetical protein